MTRRREPPKLRRVSVRCLKCDILLRPKQGETMRCACKNLEVEHHGTSYVIHGRAVSMAPASYSDLSEWG